MAWLGAPEIRAKFNIQSSRFDTQIEAAIVTAALTLQRAVSDAVYAEAVSVTPPAAEPELLRYNSVVESHSYLTAYFLFLSVGSRLSEAGFVKSQQDSASPATGSRVVTNSYLTPKEIRDLRADLLAMAKLHLGEYGTIDISGDPTPLISGFPATSITVRSDW